MSSSKTLQRFVFEILLLANMNLAEVIDDSWIRSQTNYHFALSAQARTTPQTQSTTQSKTTLPGNTLSKQEFVKNVQQSFKLIDEQYAQMMPSVDWPEFSVIREDAIFLQYYSNLKRASNTSEDLLPEVYRYFEEWPTVRAENWRSQLSRDELLRYLEYTEKHITDPPHLVLRWIIFATWLLKSQEWNNSSKVPEPMLTQFKLMATAFRRMNVEQKTPIVEIGRANVDAFRNGFFI